MPHLRLWDAGKSLSPDARAGLQEDGAHLPTSPGPKPTEKCVLLEDITQMKGTVKGEKGWSKTMLGRENTL